MNGTRHSSRKGKDRSQFQLVEEERMRGEKRERALLEDEKGERDK